VLLIFLIGAAAEYFFYWQRINLRRGYGAVRDWHMQGCTTPYMLSECQGEEKSIPLGLTRRLLDFVFSYQDIFSADCFAFSLLVID